MGINTLEIANRLEAAEREGRTAEEIALVFQEVFEQQLGQLVTKDYLHAELDRLRAEFRAEIAQLRTEMAELRAELKGEIAALRAELKGETAALRAELKDELAALRAELKSELGQLRNELEGDIADLRSDSLGLRGELQVLRADMEKMELRITNAPTVRLGALIAGAVAVLGGLNIFF
jgi:uncharacterized protein involved in exopolysaccharide biosynthesis